MFIIELISDICSVGGGQTLVSSISSCFNKTGNKTIIISLYKERQSILVESIKKEGTEIIFLNKKRGVDFNCSKRLKRLILKLKPDVVHAHLSTFVTLFLANIPKNIKVFYTFHSIMNKDNSGSKLRLDNLLIKHMVRRKKMIPIAISNIVKKSLFDFYGFEDVAVIDNGVDLNVFRPPHCSDHFVKKYDFIVIGSFTAIKNQIEIINIFNEVYLTGASFTSVFLGDGQLLDACKLFVNEHRLDACIKFVGNVSNVNEYLASSSFLVSKSLFEGNPMVINEAIASGVFIISNGVGGIPDIVNDKNGIIVKNDFHSFKETIISCLKNRRHYEAIIEKNIQENREKVSVDKTCKCYLNLFNQLLLSKI